MVDVVVQGPFDGAPCSAVRGVVMSWVSCVDELHPCIREARAHDVGGRRSFTLSGASPVFDPSLSGYVFPVKGLVLDGVWMPRGAGQVIVLRKGIYCVGCALGVRV